MLLDQFSQGGRASPESKLPLGHWKARGPRPRSSPAGGCRVGEFPLLGVRIRVTTLWKWAPDKAEGLGRLVITILIITAAFVEYLLCAMC